VKWLFSFWKTRKRFAYPLHAIALVLGCRLLGSNLPSRRFALIFSGRSRPSLPPDGPTSDDCAECNSHALTCSSDSRGGSPRCGHGMRERGSLSYSPMLERDDLDPTTKEGVLLFESVKRRLQASECLQLLILCLPHAKGLLTTRDFLAVIQATYVLVPRFASAASCLAAASVLWT